MLERAASSDADVVFCDLEDSVSPSEKDRARATTISALVELDWGRKLRGVRINAIDSIWAVDDIIKLATKAGDNLDLIIVPKVKRPRDIWFVETLLNNIDNQLSRRPSIALEILIEEVEALVHIDEIAFCSPRIQALIIGPGDLAASQGVRTLSTGAPSAGYPGDLWHYARSRLVVAARAAGVDAIDGPFSSFRDPDGYRAQAVQTSIMGFVGKWAIHPSQIPIANDVFSPTAEELNRAKEIVAAYNEAERHGFGAANHNGHMIDAATVRILRGILERGEMVANVNESATNAR